MHSYINVSASNQRGGYTEWVREHMGVGIRALMGFVQTEKPLIYIRYEFDFIQEIDSSSLNIE